MQSTSWADGLELIGDDQRLVAHIGAVSAGGSTRSMTGDRSLLIWPWCCSWAGRRSATSGPSHTCPGDRTGPLDPDPCGGPLAEAGELALGRINAAVVAFRRHW